MADVSAYKRCIMAYASSGGAVVHNVGDLRLATDPVVTASPTYWVVLADADFTSTKVKWH